jgi:hypothetical protein
VLVSFRFFEGRATELSDSDSENILYVLFLLFWEAFLLNSSRKLTALLLPDSELEDLY